MVHVLIFQIWLLFSAPVLGKADDGGEAIEVAVRPGVVQEPGPPLAQVEEQVLVVAAEGVPLGAGAAEDLQEGRAAPAAAVGAGQGEALGTRKRESGTSTHIKGIVVTYVELF